MKKLTLLFSIIAGIAMMTISSCTKEHSAPDPTPIQPPTVDSSKLLPTTPTFITVKADTALYDSSATLRLISSDGAVTLNGKPFVSVMFAGLTKDTTVTLVATNTNSYGSKSLTNTFTVKVWSLKSTLFQNAGVLRWIAFRGLIKGHTVWDDLSTAIPAGWWVQHYANGRLIGYGQQASTWSWVDVAQTMINWGTSGQFTIQFLPGNKFILTQVDSSGNITEITLAP